KQAGATPAEEEALKQAQAALASTVAVLPFDELLRLLGNGALWIGQHQSAAWGQRPELGDPHTCLAQLEEAIVYEPVTATYTAQEHLGAPLVRSLGRARFAPAAPLLARLLLSPHNLLDRVVGPALRAMAPEVGRAAVRDELLRRIDEREVHFDPP